jgi:hypothetical protein
VLTTGRFFLRLVPTPTRSPAPFDATHAGGRPRRLPRRPRAMRSSTMIAWSSRGKPFAAAITIASATAACATMLRKGSRLRWNPQSARLPPGRSVDMFTPLARSRSQRCSEPSSRFLHPAQPVVKIQPHSDGEWAWQQSRTGESACWLSHGERLQLGEFTNKPEPSGCSAHQVSYKTYGSERRG